MTTTITRFRDHIVLDDAFMSGLGAQPGESIIVGARLVEVATHLGPLPPSCALFLLADQLTVQPGAVIKIAASDANQLPSVTIYAAQIVNQLQIVTSGT